MIDTTIGSIYTTIMNGKISNSNPDQTKDFQLRTLFYNFDLNFVKRGG